MKQRPRYHFISPFSIFLQKIELMFMFMFTFIRTDLMQAHGSKQLES